MISHAQGETRGVNNGTVDTAQMRWDTRRGSAQPHRRNVGPSVPGGASRTVPDHNLKIWAALPRRLRQRACRGYFRDQASDEFPAFLSTINARIVSIESTLAEFLHATAASISVPPAQSCTKRASEDAGLPSSPALTSTSKGIISDIFQAEELIPDTTSSSPFTSNISSASAAVCSCPSRRRRRSLMKGSAEN